jgi:hypothetical protein
VGHHGGHGTTAAAMVHHVLAIYMSFVRELYVKYTFLPKKIFIALEQFIPPVACCNRRHAILTSKLTDMSS